MKTIQSSSGVERTDVIFLQENPGLLLVSKTHTLLFLGNYFVCVSWVSILELDLVGWPYARSAY